MLNNMDYYMIQNRNLHVEWATYILMFVALISIIQLGFLSLLFSCSLTCLLILSINKLILKYKSHFQKIEQLLPINKHLTENKITIISTFLLTFVFGLLLFYGVNGLAKLLTIDNIHLMSEKMTNIIVNMKTNENIPTFVLNFIPQNLNDIKQYILDFIAKHISSIGYYGKSTITNFVYVLIGFIIGIMISFHVISHSKQSNYPILKKQLLKRIDLFKTSFENVFVAQVKISAINTLLTGLYLYMVLPLFSISLPFKFVILCITFFAGLIPVIGNLISNSVIIIFSFGISFYVALVSLIFLIVIHKLEYFLNAKIIGGKINSSAWELLLAMILFERIFGMGGVIIAPIYYAYLKSELKNKKLI